MVDIRPHRRLAVPFKPPRFNDLVEVSDFISFMYEHVGVAVFGSDMFSFTSTVTMKRMCTSLGLKLLIDCEDAVSAVQAAVDGADFVTFSPSSVVPVRQSCKALVSVASDMDLEFVKVSSAKGVFCDASFVARAKVSLGPDYVVFASGGDPVQAVKDGAEFAVFGDSVLQSRTPAKAARALAEEFREFT